METKHTPGPWTLQELETHHNGYADWHTFAVRSPANVCLAIVGTVDHHEPERIPANARLMAAAPDLLEALDVALLHIERMVCESGRTGTEAEKWGNIAEPPSSKDMEAIRAAIARAGGGAQ
jgi:hypothetical protein